MGFGPMFGKHGYLVEDNAPRAPRRRRPYKVSDFDILDEDESEEEVHDAIMGLTL